MSEPARTNPTGTHVGPITSCSWYARNTKIFMYFGTELEALMLEGMSLSQVTRGS